MLLERLKQKLSSFLRFQVGRPIINVRELAIGKNVIIEPFVQINCKRLLLGDGVVIKSGTRIEMTDLVIGDYTIINNHCFLTGTDWCRIGYNCWIGHYSIIDSIGTTRIRNGVGIGAHSQLWTHIYFGDILNGCRFSSKKPLVIEDDVWFVGHCIVSPIQAKKRSMAMVGSVITKDMQENHVYAGLPAKDITDKIGPQYEAVDLNTKRQSLEKHLCDFFKRVKPSKNRIKIVDNLDPRVHGYTQFSVSEGFYTKNLFEEEVQFIRYLHPDKARFLPLGDKDWVKKYL